MIWTWCARVAWIVLPFTTGAVLTDALSDWSRPPSIVATVLLWAAWLGGAIALLAPRPWGFAILRVVAPCSLLCTVIADAPAASRLGAGAVALVAMVLALGAPIARASANALAYGDEDRYPLSVPATLAGAPVPLAVVFLAAGVSAGPLLLANGRVLLGVLALAAGAPLTYVAWNSLYALSRRWLVLVPAGLTLVDPLTTSDPTLMPREQIASIAAGERGPALDLRLGPARGTITLELRERGYFARRHGRTDAEVVETNAVRVAIVDRAHFFHAARNRHLPVDGAAVG